MATEYISREAAIETVLEKPDMTPDEKVGIVERLNALHPADVRAVVRCGEWIDVPNGSIKAWKRKCSACGMYHRGKTDFCPNCGADMRPIKEDGNV